MATFKFAQGVLPFRSKLIDGMVERDYDADYAERTFKQPESSGS